MFQIKLWSQPEDVENDVSVPLFILQLPQKTLKKLGYGVKDWEQFLETYLKVKVKEVDELNTFISLSVYMQALGVMVQVCGAEKLIGLYVEDAGPNHSGPIGLAGSTAASVEDCLGLWTKYQYIVAPALNMSRTDTSNNEVVIQFSYLHEVDYVRDMYMELVVFAMRKRLIDASNGLADVRVRFSHPPLYDLLFYQESFGVIPEFNCAQDALVMSSESLSIECDGYTPMVHAKALADCKVLEENYRQNEQINHKVRYLLVDGAKRNQFYSLDQIAEQMNMSIRTLTRRLQQEGVGFRQLQSEIRLEMAKKQLQNTQLPIKSICSNVGFTNVSAFSRAFRKYMKVSPSDFRQEKSD